MMPLFVFCFMTGAIVSEKDKHLIFWPGQIVFNPKMTIFIQFNREIKK